MMWTFDLPELDKEVLSKLDQKHFDENTENYKHNIEKEVKNRLVGVSPKNKLFLKGIVFLGNEKSVSEQTIEPYTEEKLIELMERYPRKSLEKLKLEYISSILKFFFDIIEKEYTIAHGIHLSLTEEVPKENQ